MPCAGGGAIILTSADKAKSLRNKPVYLLGAGIACDPLSGWQRERLTRSVVTRSAPIALGMAGYSPSDIEFAQFYDCYTILHAVCLEDSGLVPKGEVGPFFGVDEYDVQRRVPHQHGRRPALMRTTRRRGRIPSCDRGDAADHGPSRRATGGAEQPLHGEWLRRHGEQYGHPGPRVRGHALKKAGWATHLPVRE